MQRSIISVSRLATTLQRARMQQCLLSSTSGKTANVVIEQTKAKGMLLSRPPHSPPLPPAHSPPLLILQLHQSHTRFLIQPKNEFWRNPVVTLRTRTMTMTIWRKCLSRLIHRWDMARRNGADLLEEVVLPNQPALETGNARGGVQISSLVSMS